uniref:DNA packaging terminase subunit 1 n=1 Tax=Oryzias latipes TaxID=8090 RepID=A0A286P9X1_ORYLA|nr:DNA packaging terminase subunit 1 [Oryzias latipes]
MSSAGHSASPAALSSSSELTRGPRPLRLARPGLSRAPWRALSPDPDDILWLRREIVRDPVPGSRPPVPLAVAVDCVRLRLYKDQVEEESRRSERERVSEYNRLMTDRVAQAVLIRELGLEGAKARVREIRASGNLEGDASDRLMYRFRRMVERVFEYFQTNGMRMEPFQMELLRGVVLGVTEAQFGDELFRHKHALLSTLNLAPLGSESYDYQDPARSHLHEVEKEFARYANPYTLCLAPRQCGKSLAMRLILAAVLLHLDINVMVQAQNKHMCTTLRLGVEAAMEELQRLPSFLQTERTVSVHGSPENRVYRFDPGYKGSSFAHFLSSSNDVSGHSFTSPPRPSLSISFSVTSLLLLAVFAFFFLSLSFHFIS